MPGEGISPVQGSIRFNWFDSCTPLAVPAYTAKIQLATPERIRTMERQAVLNSLLALDQPPEIIAGELSRFAWDVDSPLVTLTSTHAEAVLQRFVRSTLSKEDVERWANLLESREDAALALEHETVLRLLVFELANPKITRELTREVAAEWIRELRAPSTPSR